MTAQRFTLREFVKGKMPDSWARCLSEVDVARIKPWQKTVLVGEAAYQLLSPAARDAKTRKLPAIEVMFRRLANDAMRSDQKAIKLLLSLVDRYSESPEAKIELNEMLAEDEEILARYRRSDRLFVGQSDEWHVLSLPAIAHSDEDVPLSAERT
jgi:hypothetical protein